MILPVEISFVNNYNIMLILFDNIVTIAFMINFALK